MIFRLLDVLIVPLALALIAFYLPKRWETIRAERRRQSLRDLIRREIEEVKPYPISRETDGLWQNHIRKRFLHEEIFKLSSENRDFLLSLNPELTYNVTQIWNHWEKASDEECTDAMRRYHADQWCWHLCKVCIFLDKADGGELYAEVYEPWATLVREYYEDMDLTDCKRLNTQEGRVQVDPQTRERPQIDSRPFDA